MRPEPVLNWQPERRASVSNTYELDERRVSVLPGQEAAWRLTRPVAVALVCTAGLCLGADAAIGASAKTKPVTHTVVIEGTKFEPQTLTVKSGDTVVWLNKDPFPHTVTAKGVFDSHNIAAIRSWKYTTRKAGEYNYICSLHPNMNGSLIVQ